MLFIVGKTECQIEGLAGNVSQSEDVSDFGDMDFPDIAQVLG
jgi:hypothetical protein